MFIVYTYYCCNFLLIEACKMYNYNKPYNNMLIVCNNDYFIFKTNLTTMTD